MFKDIDRKSSEVQIPPTQAGLEYAGLRLHNILDGRSDISIGSSTVKLNPNETLILERLILNPEKFIPRNILVELLSTNNPKETNYSKELRKQIRFLRGKINCLYNISGQAELGPNLYIQYRKSLGYILTQNEKLEDIPKEAVSKFTFVELYSFDRSKMKIYEGLMLDPLNKAAFALHDRSTYARVGLTHAQNEILKRLIEEPEKTVTYKELFELNIGFSAEEYDEDGLSYGLLKLDYHDKRKRLGDNLTLLRKKMIGLYSFANRKAYNLPLPISDMSNGYKLSTGHRFYERIFPYLEIE